MSCSSINLWHSSMDRLSPCQCEGQHQWLVVGNLRTGFCCFIWKADRLRRRKMQLRQWPVEDRHSQYQYIRARVCVCMHVCLSAALTCSQQKKLCSSSAVMPRVSAKSSAELSTLSTTAPLASAYFPKYSSTYCRGRVSDVIIQPTAELQ